ncbi:hypothetical protein GMST_29950 [Geomonas silvestris]|uniref:Spermatogenesis-associated protein 20-like TRX domain-containing protein n=1 Tax=Geomonas silvestris TaxID=2740184 RepID=A0A6V8MKX9_9BACT|nr:thioredoxin domain-containing protein [Geomonas silvestris]GFO60670.1 hypothetical protein GMST_29950 [Geomonas silvestris]
MNEFKPDTLPGVDDETAPQMQLLQEAACRRLQFKPKFINRLILESSPYLLQHANNPVNWFPWGETALNLAKELSRPLFVSIGYATCHWCHVMEVESFANEVIAHFLNGHYISIKVDREERPDIDSQFMNVLGTMGAQGGWPLNIFLTPDGNPFYGGTYFPPFDSQRGLSFLALLQRITEMYNNHPSRLHLAGQQVTSAVRQQMLTVDKSRTAPETSALRRAVERYSTLFDPVNGGIVGAPKFPSSLSIRFLLRQYWDTGNSDLCRMVKVTLSKMACGGIYDQIGGGFHRYAIDSQWIIPHFEKMLYDNAQLATTYLEGYLVTGSSEFAAIAKETMGYLFRELKAPEKGFFSATDADSLGPNGKSEEGYFFTWTPNELTEVLGTDNARSIGTFFGITTIGNFDGRSVPHRKESIQQFAGKMGISTENFATTVGECRNELLKVRLQRPLPFRDEQMLTSWNGLAISAFSKAGFFLDDKGLLGVAQEVARFICQEMTHSGGLAHSFQESFPKGIGFLDDYAFMIAAFLDLFEATGDIQHLRHALALNDVVQNEFLDEECGGYFMTSSRHEELLAREKPTYDGAIPSGNSVMLQNLVRLYGITDQKEYRETAERAFSAFGSRINETPTAVPEMLIALQAYLTDTLQIVIVAPPENVKSADPLLKIYRSSYLPFSILIQAIEGEQMIESCRIVPALEGRHADGDKAVAYVCQGRACKLPTTDPAELSRIFKCLSPRVNEDC